MKQQDVHNLIERFLNAETSLQEEQMLMEYFRREDIPEDLKQYRDMFLDYGEVASLQLPQEENVIDMLPVQDVLDGDIQSRKQPPRTKLIWAAAASIAVLFVFGIASLYNNNKEEEKPQIAKVLPKPTETPKTATITEEKQIAVNEVPAAPKTSKPKQKKTVKETGKETETLLAEPPQGEAATAPQGNTFSYSVSNPERLKYTPEEIAALKRQARRKYEEWLQLEQEILEYDSRNISALLNETEQ